MTATEDHIDRLPAPALARPTSQAERVADLLRTFVIDGELAPGVRLSEEKLSRKYEVSRNTLREAFRLLSHERLLVHHMHRGVFVSRPTSEDVRDLFNARRSLELPAVRGAAHAPADLVRAVGSAVDEGEWARAREDWWRMGSANMRFHEALAALASSARVNEFMRQVLAETRLVFHVMAAPREFHDPYLKWNRRIHLALADGNADTAATELGAYLDTSEEQLVTAFTAMETGSRSPNPKV
ncbi:MULTISPECIES: GntR family transcriptional regulator [unclassified Nocardiopsis]|uniref:GntR family transcriptional regulator n=1 Tax=unclassified Nocardiopsis TaxID=2649073 RepID=UPI00066DC9FC|nr:MULTISPECIES: GntR family transcriptional regulator [unclassified Nocardiopsis]MBQ1083810.1 GntR family transcriptional regulator [Nocardiopsis sp. B62]